MAIDRTSKQKSSEAAFHDDWAASEDPSSVDIEAFAGSITSLENRYILQRIGPLQGKRVLDVGCGLGESSAMFAIRGANVTATDISPQMVRFASDLAERYGTQIATRTGAAEDLDFEPGSFDVIYVANTIHHLSSKQRFVEKAAGWLRPGGLFVSWDPLKYNPVINLYRAIATKVRTEDEAPLGVEDLRLLQRYFGAVESKHFWFLAQAIFIKYFLVDRISPNSARYWKLIYREDERSLWWWRPLEKVDRVLLGFPLIRWLSWNVVFVAAK
jgi:2-polyprenyl-3-methyl-5-hydroxy-6-metoxy-1,4-benzoquinol methylase